MSKYADEGSIAHALAAMCLRENTDAAAYIGRIITEKDYPHASLSPSSAHRWMMCLGSVALEKAVPFVERSYDMEVTDDMAEHVQTYVDNVRRYADGHILMVEQKLDLSAILGPGQGGTGDAIIITGDELQAHDLKFGRGVEVSATDNPQLKLYGLSALPLARMLGDIKRFRGVIHQPRIHNAPKEWDCSIEELEAFGKTAAAAAKGAHYVMGLPFDQVDGFLVPGDHCTFCKKAATCTKLARQVSDTVIGSFDAIGNKHETAQPRPIPQEAKALAAYLAKVDMIESWCNAVRAEVERQLIAGNDVPGWKLVAGKKGKRAWIEPTAVEALIRSMKLPIDEFLPRSMVSPTQAEKLLKASPKRWPKFAEHISQKEGKPHVAPVSDTRPALPKTIDQFEAASPLV